MRALHLRCLVAIAALALAGPTAAEAAAARTPQQQALASLQRTLQSDLNAAGGSDSALVVDLTTGRTLFSAAPTAPRMPASVEKLYTTTTALLKFGASARFQTRVLGVGTLGARGAWHGTLYLRGGGDPTFGDSAFDHAAYGTGATIQSLVGALKAAGVRSVSGRIVGDESYFDSLRGTPATGYRPDLEVEGELSALSFDAGFATPAELSLQTHPARFAAQQLVAALRAARVRVARGIRIGAGRTPAGAQPLASVSSPPLNVLMRLTNSPSDNFFAETLLKDLGASFGGAGTTTAGAAVVRQFVAERFGLTPALDDGSGLSRDDHTSVRQVVALLRAMQDNAPFQNSLAIAGVRGTMEYEMVGTRAADNCRGKTGTLRDVANLVGYCTAAGGDRLAFAFLMNGLGDPAAGHSVEDGMGVALADYDPATGRG